MSSHQSDPYIDVLLALVARVPETNPLRDLLLEDLAWRIRQLDPQSQAHQRARVGLAILPSFFRDRQSSPEFTPERPPARKTVDVAIVTVKPAEMDAARLVFDGDLSRKADHSRGRARFWEASLERSASRRPLRLVVTMSGESGNYDMASYCHVLLREYDVDLCVLLGMAAGRQGEVDRGDVVCATEVIDYGRAVRRPGGPQPDPKPFKPDRNVARQLNYFNPARQGWHALLEDTHSRATNLTDPGLPPLPAIAPKDFNPSYSTGVILAGDLLLEDDSLDEWARLLHKRKAKAAEMEGAGFATTCEDADVSWMVMRGIADFGGPTRDRKWQLLATLSAAAALRVLLTEEYDLDVQAHRERF
jgi:nucleoside phosphorylase